MKKGKLIAQSTMSTMGAFESLINELTVCIEGAVLAPVPAECMTVCRYVID